MVQMDIHTHYQPMQQYMHDCEYPSVIKPIIAAYSEAYRLLRQTFQDYWVDASSVSNTNSQSTETHIQNIVSETFDNSAELQKVNNEAILKSAKIQQTKKQREKLKVSKIIKKTKKQARRRINTSSPTSISASTKIIFLLTYQQTGNASKVWISSR